MLSAQTIVVGGGAAGMMAAISAAEQGDKVALMEGNPQLGKKILVSGNGRCNLTNIDADSIEHYHGGNPRFIDSVIEQYPLQQTLGFFRKLGLETKEEKRGRLFPVSDQAQAVVDVLEDCLQVLGVDVIKNGKVSVLDSKGGFKLQTSDGRSWEAARVVMASGGISLAKLGADRSGLNLTEDLGHTCTSLYPGLVALVSPDKYLQRLQGVKVRAEVRAPVSGNKVIVDTDDLLFTKYGVSGFTILNLSAQLVPLLEKGSVELLVSFFPGKTAEQISEMLKLRWEKNPHRSLGLSFAGLLSSKLTRPLLERLEMSLEQPVSQIFKAQRWDLARALGSWPIRVCKPRPFDYAEVTIGGIRTSEINPDTLESYLVPGLYIAGEMVDVHGDLGGFNFQWAWSSGYLAGQCRGA